MINEMEQKSPENGVVVKRFDELVAAELYEILRLRSAVFVVEQNCVYQDIDALDYAALHVFITGEAPSVAAYARVYAKEGEAGTAKIGRVVSAQRGVGLGAAVLSAALDAARSLGFMAAYIEAQEYAIGFYEKAGFAVTSGVFLEDGIPHVQMRRSL